MTSRSHHVTFAIGCTIVVVVTLLFLLQKTHTNLQDVHTRLLETDSKFKLLTRQFDSLFEYKERLEKSFINLKNERSNFLEMDETARDELQIVKSSYNKQIQKLEEELSACRAQDEELQPVVARNVNQASIKTQEPVVPLFLSRVHLHNSVASNIQLQHQKPSLAVQINNENILAAKDIKEKDMKEQQSPIGHVSAHPNQPSFDPNTDLVNNVLI